MAKLEIKSVQMTRPLGEGPDEVVIVATTATGETVDFLVQVPRGNADTNGGDAYCRKLGVKSYTRCEPRIETENGRRKLVGEKPVTVEV